MSRVRVSQAGLEDRKRKIDILESHIKRWEIFRIYSRQEPGRLQIKALKAAIFFAERQIVDLAKKPSDKPEEDRIGLIKYGAKIEAYEEILMDLENPTEKIDHARTQIVRFQNQIQEAKKSGGIIREEAR